MGGRPGRIKQAAAAVTDTEKPIIPAFIEIKSGLQAVQEKGYSYADLKKTLERVVIMNDIHKSLEQAIPFFIEPGMFIELH